MPSANFSPGSKGQVGGAVREAPPHPTALPSRMKTMPQGRISKQKDYVLLLENLCSLALGEGQTGSLGGPAEPGTLPLSCFAPSSF